MTLLDNEGYPTEEWLEYIKNFTNGDIHEFISLLTDSWWMNSYGVVLKRKYKGKQKLELHTLGWSGNEELINAIISNDYLTHFYMRYVMWRTGGYYYFEIKD